jgi:hypothetical protein
MSDVGDEAANRARWLAEVGEALDEAQRLTARLAQWRSDSREAVMLRVRIMAVRAEVEAMQCSRPAPKWSKRASPRPDRIP